MNIRRSNFCLIVTVLISLVATQPSLAGLTRVPSESQSINSAIASSTWGDTILVAPGTYAGNGFHDIDFGGLNLSLFSEGGPEATILDGSNTYRIFYAHTSEHQSSVVRGFTFRDGQREESWGTTGMVKIASSATINFENMIFEGGEATNGAAVHIKEAQAHFTDCTFRTNNATNRGAIYVEDGNSTLDNCLFEYNTAGAGNGAALYLGQGYVVADNCTFENNSGGTVYAYWNSTAILNDCIIRNNVGLTGVVGGVQNSSTLRMNYCLVNDNTATSDAAGAMVQALGGGFELTNCTIANSNLAGGNSSVLHDSWDAATITNCIIWGTTGGKALDRCGTVSCSLIYDNDGGNESDCFDLVGDGNLSTDPGFCEPDNGDYRIATNSPCLPEFSGGCGQIGATLNGGCALVGTQELSFGGLKAMYR